jgi:hypothetical protein
MSLPLAFLAMKTATFTANTIASCFGASFDPPRRDRLGQGAAEPPGLARMFHEAVFAGSTLKGLSVFWVWLPVSAQKRPVSI